MARRTKHVAKSTKRPAPHARSQTLPGLEGTRNGKLDNLCEGIAEVRARMNAARQEESGLVVSALQQMVAKKVTVYKHNGVELARVPGAEKLRVRLVKEHGDADDADLEAPAADNDAAGEADA